MKYVFLIALFFGFSISSIAQETPKVGDELRINEPYAQTFNHIRFPKLNFIMKRGIVSGYTSEYGTIVVVDDVKTKDDGTTYVILKKKDGSKFFGYLSDVKASYQKSIDSGELSRP